MKTSRRGFLSALLALPAVAWMLLKKEDPFLTTNSQDFGKPFSLTELMEFSERMSRERQALQNDYMEAIHVRLKTGLKNLK